MSSIDRRVTHGGGIRYDPSYSSGPKRKIKEDDSHPSPPPSYNSENYPEDHRGFELTPEQRIKAAPGILLEILKHPQKDGIFAIQNDFYTLEAVAFNINLENEEARPILKKVSGIVPDMLKNDKGVPEEGYRLASREEAVEYLQKITKPKEWVM